MTNNFFDLFNTLLILIILIFYIYREVKINKTSNQLINPLKEISYPVYYVLDENRIICRTTSEDLTVLNKAQILLVVDFYRQFDESKKKRSTFISYTNPVGETISYAVVSINQVKKTLNLIFNLRKSVNDYNKIVTEYKLKNVATS